VNYSLDDNPKSWMIKEWASPLISKHLFLDWMDRRKKGQGMGIFFRSFVPSMSAVKVEE
jgi:hypothetical protein